MDDRNYSFSIAGLNSPDHLLTRAIRRRSELQLRVYRFLEKPRGTVARLYHFAEFALIIFVYVLSAIGEFVDRDILPLVRGLELFLAIYLLAEFLARLWAVGAVAKFRGFRGRLAYLCRPISLIDLAVLCASAFFLFMPEEEAEEMAISEIPETMAYNNTTTTTDTMPILAESRAIIPTLRVFSAHTRALDQLRFVQILRLLHIDRQMSAWALLNKMVQRSRFELCAAYYIALMIFLTLAVSVFTAEQQQQTDKEPKTFQNFGDSFWFSIVTVLTIGYGDIVPRGWLSRLAVCLFSYLGLSMFSAASGLVGVGMSLTLSNERQRRQQRKLRDLAARLIQSRVRYWLIREPEGRFYRIRIFRKLCARLKRAEQRIRKTRAQGQQQAQKKQERKHSAVSGLLMRVLKKRAMEKKTEQQQQQEQQMTIPGAFAPLPHKVSIHSTATWPRTEAEMRRREEIGESEGEMEGEEEVVEGMPNDYEEEGSGMDEDSNFSASSGKSENVGGRDEVDDGNDPRCGRYRAMLSLCYFLTFVTLRKKFSRARDPGGEFANAEQELCEMEHQRGQKLRELESRLDALLGRDDQWEGGIMAPLGERMDRWEARMEELERRGREMERMAEIVLGELTRKANEGKEK